MRQQNLKLIIPASSSPGIRRRLFCKWMAWFSFCGATAPFLIRGAFGAEAGPVAVASTEELASAWSFKEFTFSKEIEIRGVRQVSSFPGIAIRLPDLSLYVISLVCPHEGCQIEFDEPLLVCPCHRSLFDPLQDGKVLSGPAPRSPWHFDFVIDKGKIVVRDLEPGGERLG